MHSQTGQAPLERFLAAGAPSVPSELQLQEAFRWSERRTVTKTGTVTMHGNAYEVDPELAGRQVDLVFDPLELSEVKVRLDGRDRGKAVPLQIKRHVHPRAQPPAAPAERTGIDYLGLIERRHDETLEQRIDYRNLLGDDTAGDGRDDAPGHDHDNDATQGMIR
ncbi:MAG: Mu transposase C-terminal domain-containing protein [Solirubrobacteraceae bacterium]